MCLTGLIYSCQCDILEKRLYPNPLFRNQQQMFHDDNQEINSKKGMYIEFQKKIMYCLVLCFFKTCKKLGYTIYYPCRQQNDVFVCLKSVSENLTNTERHYVRCEINLI